MFEAEDKLKLKKKILILNDASNEFIIKHVFILVDFMQTDLKNNGESIEYLRLKLTDSEKTLNAKELSLEWAVL